MISNILEVQLADHVSEDTIYWSKENSGCLPTKVLLQQRGVQVDRKERNYPQWWSRVLKVYKNDKRAEIAASINIQLVFPTLLEGDGASVWVKPDGSTVKISVDAATFRESTTSGIGMVARDSSGPLIPVKSLFKPGLVSLEIAEVLGINVVLGWAAMEDWQRVMVESNCLVPIAAIRSSVAMSSPFGCIVEDCQNILKKYNLFSVLFVKQSANIVALELARESYSFPDRIFDRSYFPYGVDITLLSDSDY
ncbi:hypothetical protein AgCh_022262 [Apium graveolens]